MSLFGSRPAIPLERGAAAMRTLWFWPVLLVSVTLLLDAFSPLMPSAGARGFLWIDIAAAIALAVAVAGSRSHDAGEWATPFDGRILAGFMLAILQVVAARGNEAPVLWLRQIAASGVCFYAIASRLRREPLAPDAVWPAFAVLVLGLSAATLGAVTQGTAAVAGLSLQIDERWVSQHGISKVLLLGTVLCIGRAAEPGARAMWRVTGIVGALATLVLWGVHGTGLSMASLTSLDEPFYFGNCIVSFLLLAGAARMAWGLSRERPEEAARWRATALTFVIVAIQLVFGGTTGGEGVRMISAVVAAGTIAAHLAPPRKSARPVATADAPVARAA